MKIEKIILSMVFALLLVAISMGTLLYLSASSAYASKIEPDSTGYSTQVWNQNGVTGFVVEEYKYEQLGRENLAEIMSRISTPAEMIKFRDSNFNYIRDSVQYVESEYIVSLERFYENGWNGDCEDFAIATAGLLADDGYQPRILYLTKEASGEEIEAYRLDSAAGLLGHAIYVYQENGMWGSIGTTSSDDRLPEFDTLEELVKSFESGYELAKPNYIGNLNKIYPNNAWINGKNNLATN